MEFEKTPILGTYIHAVNFKQTLEYCAEIISARKKTYICLSPAHSIMDCYSDDNIRTIFNNSGLTVADGMAVVWILKIKGYKSVERIYGPDLLLALSKLSISKDWKHYFYGSSIKVLGDLEQNLQVKFPGMKIVGKYSPPYSEGNIHEDAAIIEKINEAAPDIIWVGLGSPKQDSWMADHRDKLNAPILIGVGAAFDFVSGQIKQAPKWIQRSGFEWLFRLMIEPKRLWKRYSKYPLFVLLVSRELINE